MRYANILIGILWKPPLGFPEILNKYFGVLAAGDLIRNARKACDPRIKKGE